MHPTTPSTASDIGSSPVSSSYLIRHSPSQMLHSVSPTTQSNSTLSPAPQRRHATSTPTRQTESDTEGAPGQRSDWVDPATLYAMSVSPFSAVMAHSLPDRDGEAERHTAQTDRRGVGESPSPTQRTLRAEPQGNSAASFVPLQQTPARQVTTHAAPDWHRTQTAEMSSTSDTYAAHSLHRRRGRSSSVGSSRAERSQASSHNRLHDTPEPVTPRPATSYHLFPSPHARDGQQQSARRHSRQHAHHHARHLSCSPLSSPQPHRGKVRRRSRSRTHSHSSSREHASHRRRTAAPLRALRHAQSAPLRTPSARAIRSSRSRSDEDGNEAAAAAPTRGAHDPRVAADGTFRIASTPPSRSSSAAANESLSDTQHWASPTEVLRLRNMCRDVVAQYQREAAQLRAALVHSEAARAALERDVRRGAELRRAYEAGVRDLSRRSREGQRYREEAALLRVQLERVVVENQQLQLRLTKERRRGALCATTLLAGKPSASRAAASPSIAATQGAKSTAVDGAHTVTTPPRAASQRSAGEGVVVGSAARRGVCVHADCASSHPCWSRGYSHPTRAACATSGSDGNGTDARQGRGSVTTSNTQMTHSISSMPSSYTTTYSSALTSYGTSTCQDSEIHSRDEATAATVQPSASASASASAEERSRDDMPSTAVLHERTLPPMHHRHSPSSSELVRVDAAAAAASSSSASTSTARLDMRQSSDPCDSHGDGSSDRRDTMDGRSSNSLPHPRSDATNRTTRTRLGGVGGGEDTTDDRARFDTAPNRALQSPPSGDASSHRARQRSHMLDVESVRALVGTTNSPRRSVTATPTRRPHSVVDDDVQRSASAAHDGGRRGMQDVCAPRSRRAEEPVRSARHLLLHDRQEGAVEAERRRSTVEHAEDEHGSRPVDSMDTLGSLTTLSTLEHAQPSKDSTALCADKHRDDRPSRAHSAAHRDGGPEQQQQQQQHASSCTDSCSCCCCCCDEHGYRPRDDNEEENTAVAANEEEEYTKRKGGNSPDTHGHESNSRSSASGSQATAATTTATTTSSSASNRSSATAVSSIPYLYHLPRGPVEAMQEQIQLLEALQRVSQYNTELETRIAYTHTVHDVSTSRQEQKLLRLVQHNAQLQRTVRELQQRSDLDTQKAATLEARLRHLRSVLQREKRQPCAVHTNKQQSQQHAPVGAGTKDAAGGDEARTLTDNNDASSNDNNCYYDLHSFCRSCETANDKDSTFWTARNAALYAGLVRVEERHRDDLRALYESSRALLQSVQGEYARIAQALQNSEHQHREDERQAQAALMRTRSQLVQQTREYGARCAELSESETAARRQCEQLTEQLHTRQAREDAADQLAQSTAAKVAVLQQQLERETSESTALRMQASDLTEQLQAVRAQLCQTEEAHQADVIRLRELQTALTQAEVQQTVGQTQMRMQDSKYAARCREHAEELATQHARYARLAERLRKAKVQLAAVLGVSKSRGMLDWPDRTEKSTGNATKNVPSGMTKHDSRDRSNRCGENMSDSHGALEQDDEENAEGATGKAGTRRAHTISRARTTRERRVDAVEHDRDLVGTPVPREHSRRTQSRHREDDDASYNEGGERRDGGCDAVQMLRESDEAIRRIARHLQCDGRNRMR